MDMEEFDREMEALRLEFVSQLPLRAEKLEAALVAARDDWTEAKVDDLYRLGHSLHGTAGSFGYDVIQGLARKLSDILKALTENPSSGDDETRAKVAELVSDIIDQCKISHRAG